MNKFKGRYINRFFLHDGELLLRKQIAYWGQRAYPIRMFSEQELRNVTDNFLGAIGMGSPMHRGCIDGRAVVVKKSQKVQDDMILDEIAILSNISHKNVVRLLGCCLETQSPILVYEFIPGSATLYDYLLPCRPEIVQLNWSDRMRIIAEVADAVNYLHTHSSMAIVHRDIKSSNILLDEHRTAKIGGFDISLPMTSDRRRDGDRIAGTFGYIDPEYAETGVVDEKSDVYSLGAIMLEVLTGRKYNYLLSDNAFLLDNKPSNYVEYFTSHTRENSIAEILEPSILCQGRMEQIQAFCELALKCLHMKREGRPTMKEVVQELREIRNKWTLQHHQ